MYVLALDTEQAELLREAAMFAQGALNARLARADPDKTISNSFALQARKMLSVERMLQRPMITKLSAMPAELQAQIAAICTAISQAQNPADADAAFAKLRIALGWPETPHDDLAK